MKKLLLICLCFFLLSWKPPINLSKLSKAKKALELVSGAAHKISEEEEYYIGRAVAANILSQYPLWKNSEATRYLNLIGKVLALKSARPEIFAGYHFSLLDSDEANAFSAPGGIIFLTRGIVDMTENEDELAAILAHEIQHVAAKDPLKAIKSQRMKALGTFAAGEAIGSSSQVLNIFQDSIMDISGTLLQKGYSRKQEKNADLGAIELLKATGYDTRALLAMLQKVKAVEKKKAKAFSAHPSASKRIAYVEKQLDPGSIKGSSSRLARFKRFVSRHRN
ncbi:MAG TPA: M48 family metalloprotease [Patescibacteria group bacterium]|nr:M48 family metalloprotease [Patescibacteria group bacterium]